MPGLLFPATQDNLKAVACGTLEYDQAATIGRNCCCAIRAAKSPAQQLESPQPQHTPQEQQQQKPQKRKRRLGFTNNDSPGLHEAPDGRRLSELRCLWFIKGKRRRQPLIIQE